MTKSLDPPSKIIEQVMALAGALEKDRNRLRSGGASHEQTVEAEQALRRFLIQQSPSSIYLIVLVVSLGAKEFKPETFLAQFKAGKDSAHRSDEFVTGLMNEPKLSTRLAQGLGMLVEQGISADTLGR